MYPSWDLEALKRHWGGAYLITHKNRTGWVAQRRDNGEKLTASNADDLRGAIVADYSARPIGREFDYIRPPEDSHSES